MAAIPDFWKLLVDSRLFDTRQCQQLAANFAKTPASGQDDSQTLAQWLITQNIISRYQAGILLSGRPGPFHYGAYKIYDRIENGRLKGVFRAVHAATNHPVVLYFLAGPGAHDTDHWEQLAVLPQLDHPNIVRCLQAVDLGSYKFLVWEDLRGASVADSVKSQGRTSPAEACRIAKLAAAGLAGLHQAGRPHGDVQPRNMWLDKSGNVKLLVGPDIDLRPSQLDSEDELLRRADYLAPEFSQPGRAPDALTDIYALGCTLYELIAGQPPFPGGTAAEKLRRHATEPPQLLDSSSGSAALQKTVAYILAKNPDLRFQQAAVVVKKLEPFAQQAPTKVRAPVEVPTQAAFDHWLRQQRPAAAALSEIRISIPPRQSPENKPAIVVAPSSSPVTAPRITVIDRPAARGKPTPRTLARHSVLAEQMSRAQARQRKNTVILIGGVGMAALLIGMVLFALSNMGTSAGSGDSEQPQPNPETAKTGDAIPEEIPDADLESDGDLGGDDTQLLWASPTNGTPIELDELPGGAQVFLFARPAEIAASEEGQRVLQALGPDFAAARSQWESAAGFGLREITQLVIGLYGNAGRFPHVACVLRLANEISSEDLLRQLGSPVAHRVSDATYYTRGQWAFYLPPAADRPTFVMGHEEQIKDLAESGGGPPLLRREMGRLLRVSDQQRHFTVLFAPNFLFSDGRALFSGEREKVLDPLESLLGDDLKAGMVGTHFGRLFYFEMRMESDIVVDRFTLASNFRNRLAQIPDGIETYIAALNPHPYWRRVAFRYPAMVRFLHGQTRVGVEGNHALINAALPESAAHNLVFGAEMALASTPGALTAATEAPVAVGPQTIEDVLATKMSISFDQDSLEFSLQNVETEVKTMFKSLPFAFKIKIQGDDLKLDGITRNQQIRDFRQQDETVADVLTAMAKKANPVTTVKDPREGDQKLLWVIAPDPENPSNRIILVTTRQVAEQKYTLPEVFRSR